MVWMYLANLENLRGKFEFLCQTAARSGADVFRKESGRRQSAPASKVLNGDIRSIDYSFEEAVNKITVTL